MTRMKRWLLIAAVLVPVLAYATWPGSDVDTTDLDATTDSPAAARADLLDLAQKFNALRNHVSTYIRGLLDDPDAGAARATLGLGTMATQAANNVAITGGAIDAAYVSAPMFDVTDTGNNAGRLRGAAGGPINSAVMQAWNGSSWVDVAAFTSDKTVVLQGGLYSNKACASGYTRITPNFCMRPTSLTTTALTRDACTAITLPTDAKAVLVQVELFVGSANATGTRFSDVVFYDGACSSAPIGWARTLTREWVARTAGEIIQQQYSNFVLITNGTPLYMKHTDDGGNQGGANYQIRGYWD